MRHRLAVSLVVILPLVAALGYAASSRPVVAPQPTAAPARPGIAAIPGVNAAAAATTGAQATSTAPASQPRDYYSLSAEEFLRLPQLAKRLSKTKADIPLLEAAVFHRTNHQRLTAGLSAFQYSFAMHLMARRHSVQMSELQFFDHTSPDPSQRLLVDRLRHVGLVNVTAAENIAVLPAREIGSGRYIIETAPDGSETWRDELTGKRIDYCTYDQLAQAVVAQWKDSPTHWKNITDPQLKYLGVGIARGPYDVNKQDSFYFTQNFCAVTREVSESSAQTLLQLTP